MEDIVFNSQDELFNRIKPALRSKKKIYGELVKSYSEVSNVASATIADYFKGISSFEYINEFLGL